MSLEADKPDSAEVDPRAELQAERAILDGLARIAPLLAAEVDGDALMQRLTDEATGIVGAQFGAFFYNVTRPNGDSYLLYTLSGAPREAFERFSMPRNTAVFAPTFAGQGVVRSDDITQDPRYGQNTPHRGMPSGHLPVVSYLAVPVQSRTGVVLGGLFFGHGKPRMFGERQERAALALSAIAGPLLDNAALFRNLRELADGLEARVQERTASLQEVNAELEAFSYTVSHDLRAPIRHIVGFIELFELHNKDRIDEKSRHYLKTIKLASGQMSALIDGLLSFSRLGRAELNKRSVSLAEMVRGIWQELERDFGERRVELRATGLPEVWADEALLRVVLVNLLGNAIKYTRKRDLAVIEMGAERRGSEDVVWVKDNGAGFDMAYVKKLFGVFQRLHAEAEFEGTGIGLATARRIVVRHGGRIWAQSQPDQGASFFIALPCAEVKS